jgi:hypothetical protein
MVGGTTTTCVLVVWLFRRRRLRSVRNKSPFTSIISSSSVKYRECKNKNFNCIRTNESFIPTLFLPVPYFVGMNFCVFFAEYHTRVRVIS